MARPDEESRGPAALAATGKRTTTELSQEKSAGGETPALPSLALTLIQPMGAAIVYGHKPFENRSRNIMPVAIRGKRTRVAIHNGAKWSDSYEDLVMKLAGFTPRIESMCIIGVATFTGRVFTWRNPPPNDAEGRDWFFGPIAFEIDVRESVAFKKPIPCKGALGFWSLPADVDHRVREQLAEAA